MARTATLKRRLICLALAAIMVLSAAVSAAHSISHAQAGPAAGQHESHADATARKDGAPAKDKQDGGHDHLLSLSVPIAALFGETLLVHPPLAAPAAPEVIVKTLALRGAEPPPADPPRTA